MFDLKQITLAVCKIARQTGEFQHKERENFSLSKVEQKNNHDYVSYVDKASEELIVGKLKELLPEAGFITEEGTVAPTERTAASTKTALTWIVDPLDGTTNYIQDYAPYCVSIALRQGDEFLIGVVYEVYRDECFYAWKGGGAYMNGSRIQVSTKNIESAFIGLDLPYNAEEYKPLILHIFNELYGKVSSIRINGSAAMGLCYVAIGRYDGWGEAFIKSWDYSAGVLIVREAGGTITDFRGEADIMDTHHVVATNGMIHDELRGLFSNLFHTFAP